MWLSMGRRLPLPQQGCGKGSNAPMLTHRMTSIDGNHNILSSLITYTYHILYCNSLSYLGARPDTARCGAFTCPPVRRAVITWI